MIRPVIIIDPGHGLSNRRRGVFDPGTVHSGIREADIVMDWANEFRAVLLEHGGIRVVRTRVDHKDPCPVGDRAAIARHYKGRIMISFHCNWGGGKPNGTETFYRHAHNHAMAGQINQALVAAMGTKDRGAKTESQSQHARLAVLSFDPCFLIELGFVDHTGDREKMLDPLIRRRACEALARTVIPAL